MSESILKSTKPHFHISSLLDMKNYSGKLFFTDIAAGIVVFLVALPLCLGIALASGAPLLSGLITGIIGGVVVGVLSGSHTSVSGPAAGLTAVVAAQISALGSYQAFLLAVVLAGIIQILLGFFKAGALSAFFPTSVINGLLAAIGVILILKQIPHLLGHDKDYLGDFAFVQPNEHTTFSEFFYVLESLHPGAIIIGFLSLGILILWSSYSPLKSSPVPGPLVVVIIGVVLQQIFKGMGSSYAIGAEHLVQVPIFSEFSQFVDAIIWPDFSQITNYSIYIAAFTIAIIASLETLLNLEAVDKIDPRQRYSPPSRELVAQGIGNFFAGLIGGIPMTSVIVRSSVNVTSGSQTRVSGIFHGLLLCVCVALFPFYLNMIPLSVLAAILIFTGYKLANPSLFRKMWGQGRYQFFPFIITLLAIVLTDLLIGVVIGLFISLIFILNSNLRTPIKKTLERHLGGEVLRVELANQVSFLNRASLEKLLREVPPGTHVLLDASATDYIDPDILNLIQNFRENMADAHEISISLKGFKEEYLLQDELRFVDYSTRELQEKITPGQVLVLLKEGNDRFLSKKSLSRDFDRSVAETALGQHPLAIILSCIDSRNPAEVVLDLGIGDIFSVRVAGNVVGPKVLGSIEYATAVAGAKLVVVMGHTRCGAVTASVDLFNSPVSIDEATGCEHLDAIINRVSKSIKNLPTQLEMLNPQRKEEFVDSVAKENVLAAINQIVEESHTVRDLLKEEKVALVGALYDVRTGKIDFFEEQAVGL
ncbi:MAG TPA: SulP family inorganic anion transporter [Oligoflexia bacterium]|nr:SulP family inorganic anion transporter [Oligoflexia bacterium]